MLTQPFRARRKQATPQREGQIVPQADCTSTRLQCGVKAGHVAVEVFGITVFKARSEEHTSELQSLMRISYAVFCLKKKNTHTFYYLLHVKHKSQLMIIS